MSIEKTVEINFDNIANKYNSSDTYNSVYIPMFAIAMQLGHDTLNVIKKEPKMVDETKINDLLKITSNGVNFMNNMLEEIKELIV